MELLKFEEVYFERHFKKGKKTVDKFQHKTIITQIHTEKMNAKNDRWRNSI